MRNMFDLNNKVVVVTGALGQLGNQYSKVLSGYGAKIAALDIFPENSNKVNEFLSHIGNKSAIYLKTDIVDRSQIESALDKIIKSWDVPSVLINNAALDSPPSAPPEENGPFENYPEASLDKVIDVNLKGVIYACQVFGNAMAQEKRGSIINISSIYGMVSPNQSIYEYRRSKGDVFFKPVAYAVSKSGIYNLTRYLATYWAKDNVRVNTLTLAGVFNNQDPRFLEEYCRHIPIGRMAKEDEYNGAVIFLASDASEYMTGSNMVIDGGWTAW